MAASVPAKTRMSTGVWSPEVAARVLEVVSATGSPSMAAKELGIHAHTIHYHRRTDPDFAQAYAQAMDNAFHQVLGHAFARSMDPVAPSDRLTEVLLKFRWNDRLQDMLIVNAGAQGVAGLDTRVIARMDPADRADLIRLLEKYLKASHDQEEFDPLAL